MCKALYMPSLHDVLVQVSNGSHKSKEIEKRNNEIGDEEKGKGTRYAFRWCKVVYGRGTAAYRPNIYARSYTVLTNYKPFGKVYHEKIVFSRDVSGGDARSCSRCGLYDPNDVFTNADSQRQHYNNHNIGRSKPNRHSVPRDHDATAEFHRGDTVFTATQSTSRDCGVQRHSER
jgi:hypothetical protein